MSNDSRRSRPGKLPKSSRKLRRNSGRLHSSHILSSQLPQRTETSTTIGNDFLDVIINDFASNTDDNRIPVAPSILSTTNYDSSSEGNRRRKSVGEQRLDQLMKHMKNLYQGSLEFDQSTNLSDSLNNVDKRKQYSDKLWSE